MSLRSVGLILVATTALLLTPSAASAAWTITPTPNVTGGITDTNLQAVDCSSANSCMAVGSAAVFTGAVGGPLILVGRMTVAERWDGTSWQMVPTPDPPSATFISLNGVSCPQRNGCFAVGSSASGPLLELWNGTSWSHQPSPDVGANGGLSAVSCSGLLACTAVGGSDALGPFAERWDGTGWHVQSTPDVENGPGAVSCPRKRTCTAVGQSSLTSPSPLVERWFGRINAWGLEAAPKPAGVDSAKFTGVSCPDGPVCFAVGSSSGIPGTLTTSLAERRVGSSWSVMPTPNPTPPQGRQVDAELLAVSCPGRRACHAVGLGFVDDGSGFPVHRPIAERFDGASWQVESMPDTGRFSPLTGVSCPSRFFCMAVGHRLGDPSGATLAAKWTP